MIAPQDNRPRFPLGRIVATPAALAALQQSGQSPSELLRRHAAGDWGDVGEEDAQANDEALAAGERLLSGYTTRLGATVWIITEADRSATTLLLPEEY